MVCTVRVSTTAQFCEKLGTLMMNPIYHSTNVSLQQQCQTTEEEKAITETRRNVHSLGMQSGADSVTLTLMLGLRSLHHFASTLMLGLRSLHHFVSPESARLLYSLTRRFTFGTWNQHSVDVYWCAKFQIITTGGFRFIVTTRPHTRMHHDKVIAIPASPQYVIVADNNL